MYSVLCTLALVAQFTALPVYMSRCLRIRMSHAFALTVLLPLLALLATKVDKRISVVAAHVFLAVCAYAGLQQLRGRCKLRSARVTPSRMRSYLKVASRR